MGTATTTEWISDQRMIEVTLGENDRLDWALKQFRRKLIRSGLLKDLKKRRFYEKPSEAKKRKAAAARRRGARSRRTFTRDR
ncbi:MAG TPA: 30S ribosomal protein S21 [Longimicrobiales bacterium]|nr:30S ribosomal protein S21 [Longimicrobiales bacterium]